MNWLCEANFNIIHNLLITGETKYFELKVMVDYDTAPSLTMGREKIEDILLLHLEEGKDFFVSFYLNEILNCTYLPV